MRKSGWAAAAGIGSLVLLLTACGGSPGSASATSPASQAARASEPGSAPATGTTVMTVQHSSIGWVMAEANDQVVDTYNQDKKGGAPACIGSCASRRPAATGTPKAGPADRFPGSFGVVKDSGGVEQITYNGYPLYTLAGASLLVVGGDSGGWHVVPLSRSDISN